MFWLAYNFPFRVAAELPQFFTLIGVLSRVARIEGKSFAIRTKHIYD